MIVQIAQSHSHVVMKAIGYRDRNTNAEDSVRDANRVDIPVAQK
jgi:hypothetical protein